MIVGFELEIRSIQVAEKNTGKNSNHLGITSVGERDGNRVPLLRRQERNRSSSRLGTKNQMQIRIRNPSVSCLRNLEL